MILKAEQFVGPILIEGLHDSGVTSVTIAENLGYYIELHEREYLDMILGPICSAFIKHLSDEGVEERWEDLKKVLSKDCSSLAMYVFFHYVRGVSQAQTSIGVRSESLSPYQKSIKTWNDAIPLNRELLNMLSNGDYMGVQFDNDLIRPVW